MLSSSSDLATTTSPPCGRCRQESLIQELEEGLPQYLQTYLQTYRQQMDGGLGGRPELFLDEL